MLQKIKKCYSKERMKKELQSQFGEEAIVLPSSLWGDNLGSQKLESLGLAKLILPYEDMQRCQCLSEKGIDPELNIKGRL